MKPRTPSQLWCLSHKPQLLPDGSLGREISIMYSRSLPRIQCGFDFFFVVSSSFFCASFFHSYATLMTLISSMYAETSRRLCIPLFLSCSDEAWPSSQPSEQRWAKLRLVTRSRRELARAGALFSGRQRDSEDQKWMLKRKIGREFRLFGFLRSIAVDIYEWFCAATTSCLARKRHMDQQSRKHLAYVMNAWCGKFIFHIDF